MYLEFLDDMCMVQDLKQSSLAIILLLTIAEYESLKPQNSSKQSYQAWNQTWTRPQLSTLQSSIWFSYGMHLDSRIQQSFPNFTRFVATLSTRLFKMVLWRFRPIASSPTEAKRVRLFYSGGEGGGGRGAGGRTRKFPVVGGELARGRNLQLLFNWWNRLLYLFWRVAHLTVFD